MQQLTSDLLEYARAGTGALRIQPVPMDEAVNDVLSALRASIEEAGATVTYSSLPIVQADRRKFIQVLQNLIGNAVKFRGENACHIQISVEQSAAEWKISVRDNGIGFEPEDAKRIFEMFRRAGSSDGRPGTGIGLAISKRIIESHHGRMWAESKPGEGSVFHCTLPLPTVRSVAVSSALA